MNDVQIKHFIEVECKNWMELKLIKADKDSGKTMLYLIDNSGYKYYVDICVVRTAKRRKTFLQIFLRGNKYTIDNINTYLKMNDINIKLISDNIKNAIEKLIWECPIHGAFNVCWNCIKNGQGCPMCGNIKRAENRRNSYEYIQEYFSSKNLILVSKDYKTNELPLKFICLKHKEVGVQTTSFGNLLRSVGCKICSKINTIEKMTKPHEQFVEEFENIHGNKYKLLNKYQGCKTHVKLYCNRCDQEFSSAPNHLLEGHGCPNCNASLGEVFVKMYLDNNNIEYKQQYKFEDCKGIRRRLSFDFAIFKDTNLISLIEYQGIQHYEPVNKFGGKEIFDKQQINDNLKRKYCKDKNIKLIEIPYFEIKNITLILDMELERVI